MWGQGVLKGPNQDRAVASFSHIINFIAEVRVLTIRGDEHICRIGNPFDPLNTLALRKADIRESSDLLQIGTSLGHISRFFRAQVGELLLKDVDRFVSLQGLFDAHTHCSQELRELVHLIITEPSIFGQEISGRVLGGFVHGSEPSGLASASLDFSDCLDAEFELLPLQCEIRIFVWPAILQVLARIAELASLAKMLSTSSDHDLHWRSQILHSKI
mmetsp:Transcript_129956/g.417120  ORF Transcript_129956/g.417120 Transcript_129956/m.417120 type:complete len:216 (-) Transcript_129956:107-754(-)